MYNGKATVSTLSNSLLRVFPCTIREFPFVVPEKMSIFVPDNKKKHTKIMKTRNIIMAAFIAATMSACTTEKTILNTGGGLFGEWKIEQAMGKSTANGDRPATINFGNDGRINGNASVNSFFGGYTSDGRNMSFTQVGMTRMMGQSMEIEDAVTQAINTTARISINGNSAQVYDKDGNVIMKLTRAEK